MATALSQSPYPVTHKACRGSSPSVSPVQAGKDRGQVPPNRQPLNSSHTRQALSQLTFPSMISLPATPRESSLALVSGYDNDNDPSAGSPTETLLRLLLPLDDQI